MYCGGTSTPESTETQTINNTNIKGSMHTHDEMVKLCTELVLGMTHKLNGPLKIIIAINGLKLHI